jgi:hypothetical protein
MSVINLDKHAGAFMPMIRVYRYKIYNDEQGVFLDTEFEVYAPADKIAKMGGRAIESEYLEIDDSQLNEQGFYHPSLSQ